MLQMKEKEKDKNNTVFSMLSWFRAEKVKNARVMVAGAGALGNEALKNLALFGIGNIVIVDFDIIEHSNLTRSILFRAEDADNRSLKAEVAAKRVKEINPDICTIPVCGNLFTDVGLGVYRRMDVIIGCLDSLMARLLLNRLCYRAGKAWVDGGIGDLEGMASVYIPGVSCYECTLTGDEKLDLDKHMSCADVIKINENAGRVATTPVSASIIAAIQVQEAMKIIHEGLVGEDFFKSLANKLFVYEGAIPSADIYDFPSYDPGCTAHEYWHPVTEISELSADTTIPRAIEIIKKNLNVDSVEINMMNNKFVDKIVSRSGNKCFYPMLPESNIPEYINTVEELRDLQINEGFYQNSFENIDNTFPYRNLTLKQIGIPYLDVIKVSTEKRTYYVELSNDIKYYERIAG